MRPVSFPLPSAISSTACVYLDGHGEEQSYGLNCDNLFLLLYRLVPGDPGTQHGDSRKAHLYLDALSNAWPKAGHLEALEAIHTRRTAQLQTGRAASSLTLETDTRLIAGLGYDGPLEIGMTLHPLHGFPYLPGTTVKGVARTWARESLLSQGKTTEDEIRAVFGSQADADSRDAMKGHVTFFDALPVFENGSPAENTSVLDVDILTPHQTPYYSGNELHGDWHQPTPVPFLTVAPGVAFRFALSAQDEDLLKTARSWLLGALTMIGAGGKSRSGYGYFRSPGLSDTPTSALSGTDEESSTKRADEERSSGFPPSLEPVTSLDARTDKIPARVVENDSGTIKVRLHAEGFREEAYTCRGISDQFHDSYPVGSLIYVKVSIFRKGKLYSVSFNGNLNL